MHPSMTLDRWSCQVYSYPILRHINIDGTYHHLSYSDVEVPSGQTVIFEVALKAGYYIDNGSVVLDFSYQDYSVKCPGVNIELLTAPTMVTGLHPVSS